MFRRRALQQSQRLHEKIGNRSAVACEAVSLTVKGEEPGGV
jgi:hypothetical protein